RLGDAPVAGSAVHPDALDPEVDALVHRALGAVGPGADDDPVDVAGDLAQVVVAAVALDLVGVRVDREDLVAPLAEALVDDIAAVALGVPGDAGDGDSLAGQELRRRVVDALHVQTSSYARTRGMLRREASPRIGAAHGSPLPRTTDPGGPSERSATATDV